VADDFAAGTDDEQPDAEQEAAPGINCGIDLSWSGR
jgi:hypothetical protein